MKYTVQVPVVITLEVEADCVEDAVDSAAATLQDADITMGCQYNYHENWENVEVYDAEGNYVEAAE